MKKFIVAVMLALAGCQEYGPELREEATVVDLPFVPAGHGTGIGTSVSSNGKLGTTVTSVHIPARYAVVFECQHGRFVVQGEEGVKPMWSRFKVGQPVWVMYREVFDDPGGPVVDLDFLRAEPR